MKNKKLNIVIIGRIGFPYKDASSNRIMGISQAIKHAGHEVFVVGMNKPRLEDKNENGTYSIEGIDYGSFNSNASGAYKFRLVNKLDEINKKHGGIDLVLLYFTSSYLFASGIFSFCQKNKVPFVADVVEWYSLKGFVNSISITKLICYYLYLLSFIRLSSKADNFIAISSYLENYYKRKNKHVLRLPPIIDIKKLPDNKCNESDKIKIIYAGNPGKKDLLCSFIDALGTLSKDEQKKIEVNLFAPYEQMEKSLGKDRMNRVYDNIFFHDKVPKLELSNHLTNSDFTILIRENNRVSKAGFPSKIPECMGHGIVPVITLTSDLHSYCEDGTNCFVLESTSLESCSKVIKKIANLERTKINEMKTKARKTAEKYFHYENYSRTLSDFLTDSCE